MANRLFVEWASSIAEFVMAAWEEEAFSDDVAADLTTRAVRELLPSPPKSMGASGVVVSSMRSRLVLSRALIRSTLMSDRGRAHKGLAALATALGMDEAAYLKLVAEVLEPISSRAVP
jgi:hypothetical protein